jgi:hypothetical protein
MRHSALAAVALVLLYGTSTAADPLHITSGRITVTDEPGAFSVAGSDFDVHVGWAPAFRSGAGCGGGCPSGGKADLTATYGFSDLFQGVSGSINGVSYPTLFTDGELTFDGPAFTAPFSEDVPISAPFTFHGNVFIFDNEGHAGPPLFRGELTGAGTAGVSGLVDSSRFFVEDVVYTFTSPTPEPSTLVTLISGLLGTATLRRRRSHNR